MGEKMKILISHFWLEYFTNIGPKYTKRCRIATFGGYVFKEKLQCYQKCPNFGFSPNLDLSTEIVLIWYDFSYQDQH